MPHLKASTAPSRPGMAMDYHRRRDDDHHCSLSSPLSSSQFPHDDGPIALGAAIDHNTNNSHNNVDDNLDNDIPIQEATKGYLGTSDTAVMALARNTQNSHKIESFDSVSSSSSSSAMTTLEQQRSQSMTTTEHYGYRNNTATVAASTPAHNHNNNNKSQSMVTPSPAGDGGTKRSSSTSSMCGSKSISSNKYNNGPILTIFGSSRWTASPIRVRRRVSAEEDEMDNEDDEDKEDLPSQRASVVMRPPTNLRYVMSSHDHHHRQRVGSSSPSPAVWPRQGNAVVGDKRPAAQGGGEAPLKKNKIKDQEDKLATTTDIVQAPIRSKRVLEVEEEKKEEDVAGNQNRAMDVPPPPAANDDDLHHHQQQRASPPVPYHPYPPPAHQRAPYGGGSYPGMYHGYKHHEQHHHHHDHHAHYVQHHHAPPPPPPGRHGAYQHGHGAPIPPLPPPHHMHRHHPHYHPYHYRGPPPPPPPTPGGPRDRAASAGQPPAYPGPPYPGMVGNYGPTSTAGWSSSATNNGEVRGSPTTTYRTHPSMSANRCVPLKTPVPAKASTGFGDVDMAQEVVLPDFHRLVNYPDYLTKGSQPSLSSNDFMRGSGGSVSCGSTAVNTDGRKNCVMCGKLRVCSATSLVQSHKGRAKTDTSSRSNSSSSSSSSDASTDEKEDGTAHIIPRQNKGLCTACDVSVWVVTATGMEIKWCKGCKNFRPWAAFGDKGVATKCVRCRERQREKYALQNKMRSSQQAKQGSGSDDAPPSSLSLPALIKQEDHDLAAARGLQNLFQAAANNRV